MRFPVFVIALLAGGCRGAEPPRSLAAGDPHRAPIGFVGDWVRTAPPWSPRDTLTLRADSSARGYVLRYAGDTLLSVTRWKIMYTSRDPATARRDWWGHRDDGGDAECSMRSDSTCSSGPLLCVGDTARYQCLGFRFDRDSLALSSGDRFVRAAAPRQARRNDDAPRGR